MLKSMLAATLLLSSLSYAQEVTPTKVVLESVEFKDDLNLEFLDLAIERQLNYFQKSPNALKGTIKFGSRVYAKTVLRDSLLLLRDMALKYKTCLTYLQKSPCAENLNRDINERFTIYMPKAESTHFTSYLSPDLTGSRVPTARFTNAIYGQPAGAARTSFSRVQIDYDKKLAGKNLEVFYVEDSFYEIFLFHVQGGGRITIHNPDGSTDIKYLSMTGSNEKRCEFMGGYLHATGQFTLEEARRIPVQRKYFQENPDKLKEALKLCPSYVFFRESDQEPVGKVPVSLTMNRSLAMDRNLYLSTGLITFVKTQKAVDILEDGSARKEAFSRFFLAQDTGSKINGAARCDLYMGYGPVAEMIAYSMNDRGEQYFLIRK